MTKSAIAVKGPLIKTLIFAFTTLLVLALVAQQLGQFRFNDRTRFEAEFTNASELLAGDPVLLNGVEVGKVDQIGVLDHNAALVSFDVDADVSLSEGTRALVRYRNLTGDRYLELVPGPETANVLEPGARIPVNLTRPAIDLDVLIGGLKPLFTGLDPEQVNQFSREIVAVLQGQGGNIESILQHVASFGRTIAEKDDVIARTITNLNSVLGNLGANSVGLNNTIKELQTVASALANDRTRIGRSLVSVNVLSDRLAALVGDLRGPFNGFVTELDRVALQANKGTQTIDQVLSMLPGAYLRLGRLGSRGAGYSIYVCALRAMIDGPNGKPLYLPWLGPDTSVDRCQPGTAPLETPEERERANTTRAGE